MTRYGWVLGVLVAVATLQMTALPQAQTTARPVADDASKYTGVIKQYCSGCHNGRANSSATASGVVFDTIDLQNVAGNAAMWEKVVRKLRAGAMPPTGMPHPEVATQTAMLAWLEQRLDAAAATPNPAEMMAQL